MGHTQLTKTNPYVIAAAPLLALMTQVKHSKSMPDVKKLHEQMLEEIKHFGAKLTRLGFAKTPIDCAAYCLCAALDEVILSTTWGVQSAWSQHSLLTLFKSETYGGERFYAIAETLAKEPRRYIYVLELIYLLLSLGFEGRFFGKKRVLRDEVRSRLFHLIRHSRGKVEKALALNWRDIEPVLHQKKKKHVLRRVWLATVSAILILLFVFNILAYNKSRPLVQTISALATTSPVTNFSQLVDRSLFSQAGGHE